MEFTPEALLDLGNSLLDQKAMAEQQRRDYVEGVHDLPYAPQGVNAEYEALRQMARVPLIRLAVRTPCQRLRVDGVRTGDDAADRELWRNVWQANHLDARQRIVYTDALTYERGGIVSVWPNPENADAPFVQPEDPRNVFVYADPSNPFRPLWAVKRWTEQREATFGTTEYRVEMLYEQGFIWRYESVGGGSREFVDVIDNPLGEVPFVTFSADLSADGSSRSMVDALVPMQRAIDTMRFNLLLAAQFAAYKQRVVVGYDPVLRDADGNVVVQRDADGNPVLDDNGMEQPVTSSPGRVGVDRMLVFPGTDTKVFELSESNLNNYVTALDMLVATFASSAQVPPQYLVGDFKNVSGDLMVATEATLLSLVQDLHTAFGESWERVFALAQKARRRAPLPFDAEVVWADASPKSLASVASAMSQMVPNGAPARMFLEMLPGATPQKVERWMGMSTDALSRALAGDLASALAGPKPSPEEAADDRDAPGALGAG